MIDIELNAYIGPYCNVKLHELKDTKPEQLMMLSYLKTDLQPGNGYTLVGSVIGTLNLLPVADVAEDRIALLKQRQQELRAKSEAEVTRLEGEIQSLLAISYEETK
jgi:hypothetical protein